MSFVCAAHKTVNCRVAECAPDYAFRRLPWRQRARVIIRLLRHFRKH